MHLACRRVTPCLSCARGCQGCKTRWWVWAMGPQLRQNMTMNQVHGHSQTVYVFNSSQGVGFIVFDGSFGSNFFPVEFLQSSLSLNQFKLIQIAQVHVINSILQAKGVPNLATKWLLGPNPGRKWLNQLFWAQTWKILAICCA